jgi:hypothetical protein
LATDQLRKTFATNLFLPKCLGGDGMISKAEQYRCFGEKALASAEEATCEEEKVELLKIAEAWFELAEEQSDTGGIVDRG